MDGNLYEAVELMVCASLKEIRNRAPHVPGYFENILLICTQAHFSSIGNWFREELDAINAGSEDAHRWGELLQIGIIQAARVQIPPLEQMDKERWLKLMEKPRFANLAFFTLSSNSLEMLGNLDLWWSIGPEHPDSTLKRVIRAGKSDEPVRFNQRLQRLGATWELELRMKFNQALQSEGMLPVFPPVSETANV